MGDIPVNLYPGLSPALNVADIDVVRGAAGPGRRLAVWLQGCLKRCPGCANGPFLQSTPARAVQPEELLEAMAASGPLDGLTLSGGEPVLQAAVLTPVLREVRARGWNVVCYTGYAVEELRAPWADPVLADFLAAIDLLIDGEYRRELPRGGTYRPSANQRLHFLSGRIRPGSCPESPETVVRIVGPRVYATGTLPPRIRQRLFDKLRDAGIAVRQAHEDNQSRS